MDPERAGRQPPGLRQVDEEVPDLVLAEVVRRPSVMRRQMLDGLDVRLLGARGETMQLHVSNHALT